MVKSISERRLIENQVVFRQANEMVQKGMEDMEKEVKKSLKEYNNTPLFFYCECSDENCRERIALPPMMYKGIHKNRSRFTVVPGHEVLSVERIVSNKPEYNLVEKFKKPPQDAKILNKTNLDNTSR